MVCPSTEEGIMSKGKRWVCGVGEFGWINFLFTAREIAGYIELHPGPWFTREAIEAREYSRVTILTLYERDQAYPLVRALLS